jgi:hypothetical protein
MLGRHKLLLIIPATILIAIILGMPPLNMSYKLASGGPFTHCKQVQLSNRCLFHSVTSHDNPITVNLNLTPLDQGSIPASDVQAMNSDPIPSNTTFLSVPLRC